MNIEIEFRGPLTKADYQKLFQFLKKNGRFLKKWQRETYVFHTRDKALDLKVRTTNRASEIVVKKGFWGARKREEIILPIASKHVQTAQQFMVALGYNSGTIASRTTFLFEYQCLEFALIKCPKNYYFYEAEFIENKTIKNPEKHMQKVLKSLDLKVWSEREVYDFLMFCNQKIDQPFKIIDQRGKI